MRRVLQAVALLVIVISCEDREVTPVKPPEQEQEEEKLQIPEDPIDSLEIVNIIPEDWYMYISSDQYLATDTLLIRRDTTGLTDSLSRQQVDITFNTADSLTFMEKDGWLMEPYVYYADSVIRTVAIRWADLDWKQITYCYYPDTLQVYILTPDELGESRKGKYGLFTK